MTGPARRRIAFDEGQTVKKGALLARLDAAETRALVESSKVQANLDKQRLDRAAELAGGKLGGRRH